MRPLVSVNRTVRDARYPHTLYLIMRQSNTSVTSRWNVHTRAETFWGRKGTQRKVSCVWVRNKALRGAYRAHKPYRPPHFLTIAYRLYRKRALR